MKTSAKNRWAVVLLIFYAPLLLAMVAGTGFAAYGFAAWARTAAAEGHLGWGVLLGIPAFLLASFALALLPACRVFSTSPILVDALELRLPPQAMRGLSRLVRDVAETQSLPLPDEIRLHAESVAHVYEEEAEGGTKRILVIGGAALASLDRQALSGVIAHELGHFAGGDTAFSQRAVRHQRTMMHVELALAKRRWNPLGWMLRGYHLLFRLAWAANQRSQEFAADRYQVERVGEKQTARTLIAVYAIDEMPWSRLAAIAEWFAVIRTRDMSGFSEQVRRARHATPSQWEDACRRALQQKAGPFDSHPCLRDRLRAIGVSPKRAIQLAAKLQPGDAEPSEFIAGWEAIDAAMSGFLVGLVQSIEEEKRELAAILLGRSVG